MHGGALAVWKSNVSSGGGNRDQRLHCAKLEAMIDQIDNEILLADPAYADLVALAERVFEDAAAARNWLTQEPVPGLGCRVPIEFAAEVGTDEVIALLWRIEHSLPA